MAELIEICPFDQKAAVFYGDVRSALEKKGETIGSNDLLIAAKGKINGNREILNMIECLPKDLRREIYDFIEFLTKRY